MLDSAGASATHVRAFLMAGAVPHGIRRGEGECRIRREGRVVEAIFQEDLLVGSRTAVLPSVGGKGSNRKA